MSGHPVYVFRQWDTDGGYETLVVGLTGYWPSSSFRSRFTGSANLRTVFVEMLTLSFVDEWLFQLEC